MWVSVLCTLQECKQSGNLWKKSRVALYLTFYIGYLQGIIHYVKYFQVLNSKIAN